MSLVAQVLVLQVVVLIGVLGAMLALSLNQTLRAFEEQESRRTLSAAESLAVTPLVRVLASSEAARSAGSEALAGTLESARAVAGLSEAAVVSPDGQVAVSTDPTRVTEGYPDDVFGANPARAITVTTHLERRDVVLSRVPVLDDAGDLVAFVVTMQEFPAWPDRVQAAVPDLLATLGIFALIGVGGSYLLARVLKRQTLGMEPSEIAELVEHREALIAGVKEGVVGVDRDGRITALNESARQLLGWHDVAEGDLLHDTDADAALRLALSPPVTPAHVAEQPEGEDGIDVPLIVGDRLLVVNRRPLRSRASAGGAVTTLRDRTELIELSDALDASRTTTDLLRAQTHEFANQLHTVSGLLQTGSSDEALTYISGVTFTRSALSDFVSEQILDSPLAALLIAKSSAAAERHVDLTIDEEASLGEVSPALSRALITVTGNLIDNALDAVEPAESPAIYVDVVDEDGTIAITVHDTGPGLGGLEPEELFQRGFSTKSDDAPGGRGYGLALVRRVCRMRGGDVSVTENDGAVFTATLRRASWGTQRTIETTEEPS